MFAYGSGLASSLFRLRATVDIQRNPEVLEKLQRRTKVTPEEYTRRMQVREEIYEKKSFTPLDSINELAVGTVYLEKVDEKWRRFYGRVGPRPKI